MTTLAEKLAARAADNVNKTDPVTPPVEETPPAVEPQIEPTVPPFQEQPAPAEPVPEVAVDDSNEVLEYHKMRAKEPEVAVVKVKVYYKSSSNSKRGYQWAAGIFRPDALGKYSPTNEAEEQLCEALVADGYLQLIK